MKTVLYSDDINLLSYWEKALDFDCEVIEDIENLKKVSSSIIMINYSACPSTCRDLIENLITNNNAIFMMHRVPDIEVAKRLLRSGVKGYGNALMREHFIISAIHTIRDGMVWLHPEFISKLIIELPTVNDKRNIYIDKLTSREVEVALLLKTGETYKNIADKLSITPRTVKAHAQNIYVKLNVKDRLALALLLQ